MAPTQTIEFEGQLRNGSGICEFEASKPVRRLIRITDKSLEQRLLDEVPPWGGGRFIYNDPARIVAELSDYNGESVISHVISGIIIREGKGEYRF